MAEEIVSGASNSDLKSLVSRKIGVMNLIRQNSVSSFFIY